MVEEKTLAFRVEASKTPQVRSVESRGERNIEFVSLFNILDQIIPEDIGTSVPMYR